ncbi:MAG: MTAP family purine nucleoside phosphorylase [Candidatus Woesearchaeota archaeon]|nr:MAG: MTAP family purine nucleoside phosphorylase [Candidatus Woesearchaeota archaeon]
MKEIDIGIIGSYGLTKGLKLIKTLELNTKYGNPSSKIKIFALGDIKIGVLSRHDEKHTIPPHKINFRANIQALKDLGATKLITTSVVGSLKEDYSPGDMIVTSQFIDFTKNRNTTLFDGPEVYHVSMEPPFCNNMRDLAVKTLKELDIPYKEEGIYICIEGPRFSTKAESLMFSKFADIIGMTLCPEVALAREAEMCCLNISMITDYDVWKEKKVSAELIIKTIKKNEEKLKLFLKNYIKNIEIEDCICNHSLKGTKLSKD